MSSALVEMFNNTPMTTSLSIADGIKMPHASVIKLVRKYIKTLQGFGSLGFEIRVMREDGKGGEQGEIALLNEGQAIFLLTLQRNTEKVVQFKFALVKAFLELRDIATQRTPHTNNPLNLNHRADIRVSADRTFRSVVRSCRKAGISLPNALRRANKITLNETGIDMLQDCAIELPPDLEKSTNIISSYYADFIEQWRAGKLPVPYMPCISANLYRAFAIWAGKNGLMRFSELHFLTYLGEQDFIHKSQQRIFYQGVLIKKTIIIPLEMMHSFEETKTEWLTSCVSQFNSKLDEYQL